MKIAKISLAFLALALLAASAFAKNARFDGTNYSISLDYNDSVAPGDPVFIRMRFEARLFVADEVLTLKPSRFAMA